MTTMWLTLIYTVSFLLSGICVFGVVYLVMRERKEGPVLRGSFAYWFITQVVQLGSKEIWVRDKWSGNVWMYADDGVHQSIDGDHVCTFRHEKPSTLIMNTLLVVIPFLNTLVTVYMLGRIIYSTLEDGIDSNRLVSYPYALYHDHVPSRDEIDDFDTNDRAW